MCAFTPLICIASSARLWDLLSSACQPSETALCAEHRARASASASDLELGSLFWNIDVCHDPQDINA